MKWPFHTATCLVFLLLLCTPAFAIVTSDTPGSHVVEPGESAYGINLDGVALLGFATPNVTTLDGILDQCTGALITDRHVLTAAHCFDQDSDGVVDRLYTDFPFGNSEHPFVAGFGLADRSVILGLDIDTLRFAPGWPRKEADLAIVELAEDAPAEVPRYLLYDDADEVGQVVVLTGYGAAGHGASGVDDSLADEGPIKRAGLNRYEAIRDETLLAYDFDSGLQENNTLAHLDFDSDLGFGVDEVMNAPGDSGAPSFVDGAIAGVTALRTSFPNSDVTVGNPDSSWGEAGFDTRVSSYRYFLTDATDGQAVFVPEPSTWLLLLTGAIFVGWRQVATRRSPGKQ